MAAIIKITVTKKITAASSLEISAAPSLKHSGFLGFIRLYILLDTTMNPYTISSQLRYTIKPYKRNIGISPSLNFPGIIYIMENNTEKNTV